MHKLTPGTMEDVRVCFQNELDSELVRLGLDKKSHKQYLVDNLLGVPVWQPAPRWESILKNDWAPFELDLSVYPSQEVNQVRKQLYNKMVAWAGAVREALKTRGYWCNTACPITGAPKCLRMHLPLSASVSGLCVSRRARLAGCACGCVRMLLRYTCTHR